MTDVASPRNIDEALLLLQQDPPVLLKDQDGQVGNQKTKYADLVQANEKILSRLTALGVLWKTKPTTIMIPGPNGQQDPRFVLEYKLLHVESGTSESGTYPLPAGANPMQNGSAITYARRYALIAVTNTVAEGMDDDGNGYRGRQGMAQRANVRQERSAPAEPIAQRSTPAARPERARPAQRPELPAPISPAPGGPDSPLRGRGGLITEPMTRKLAISMKQALGDDTSTRKQYIVDMIGREVLSSKDLTFDEGRGLIDAFEKANQDPDTAAVTVIDIYRRVNQAGGPEAAPGPERQPGQRSRNAAEALGTGDMGTEQAPWEDGSLPV
jgi:hypothetical protein